MYRKKEKNVVVGFISYQVFNIFAPHFVYDDGVDD